MTVTAADCQSCGACCIADYDTPTYVHLVDADRRRLSPRYRKLNVIENHAHGETSFALATKHSRAGHVVCVALRGEVGKKVACEIYERRPGACSAFRPGGETCLYARKEAGIE